MKTCIFLSVLAVLLGICRAISFMDSIECQRSVLCGVGKPHVVVNTNWVGNPIYLYMCSHLGYMHNMRFFSPWIQTKYTIVPSGPESPGEDECIYIREPQGDSVHACTKERDCNSEYVQEYYTALLRMFPSLTGDCLSIEAVRRDSLTAFLAHSCKKTEALYVLAALLLLSEGVDVPIEASGSRVVLFYGKEQKSILLEVEVDAEGRDDGAPEASHLEVCQVIQFFKKHKDGRKRLATHQEFDSVEFMESTQFLINSYINKYIEDMPEMTCFLMRVYELLDRLGVACDFSEKNTAFSRIFMPLESMSAALRLLAPVINMQMHMENLEAFVPVLNAQESLETLDRADCMRSAQGICGNPLCKAIDGAQPPNKSVGCCAKQGMHAFFLCLAYSPETQNYDIYEMLSTAVDREKAGAIQTFFEKETAYIRKVAMHKADLSWNSVFPDALHRDAASFSESLSRAGSGMLNFLYAAAEMTGQPAAIVKKMQWCREVVGIGCLLDTKTGLKVRECIQDLILSLAVNKQIKVEAARTNNVLGPGHGEYGMNELLCLTHFDKDGAPEQKLQLVFAGGHMGVIQKILPRLSFSTEETKALLRNKRNYMLQHSFCGRILAKYINMKILEHNLVKPELRCIELKIAIESVVLKPIESPNRIFLVFPVQDLRYKIDIICGCLLQAMWRGIKLTQSHPIALLVSNVVGSVPLDNKEIRCWTLGVLAFTGMLETLCPLVHLSSPMARDLFANAPLLEILTPFKEDQKISCRQTIMQYFRAYREKTMRPFFHCRIINNRQYLCELFEYVFAQPTACKAEEISQILLEGVGPEDLEQARVHSCVLSLAWLWLSATRRKDDHELAIKIYKAIDLSAGYAPVFEKFWAIWEKPQEDGIVERMELMKESLVENGGNHKFVQVLSILKG
ncbi:uncharacterized protein NEMAJ01_2018 [Nematocida major]|uniref:uncharacterized protein n=1 Tax=Nematocida major TaxID=1912982 RepID=UPI002007EF0A|nr:uncharacterized protein NEMAJ01_2018 [Nematocida major]KAH9387122.1 hypothetical protein NEMAJ01_2018 [Nematocida major]